ncbi:hypothetical protein [Henriciella pelagia]|uniref:hypothetical protein n=1 Tax=Henriciella pelagia TaxID=1977912 RepID=UPI003518BD74
MSDHETQSLRFRILQFVRDTYPENANLICAEDLVDEAKQIEAYILGTDLTPDETRADIEAEDAKGEEDQTLHVPAHAAGSVTLPAESVLTIDQPQPTVSEDDGEVESVTEDVLVSVTDARGEVQQSWTDTIMACSDGRTYKNGILQDSETEATDTSEQSYTSHGE